MPVPINRGCALRTDQMLRGLLAQGFCVRLLLLNQSEFATTSKDIAKRTLEYYEHPDLEVEVRRHPRMDHEKQKRGRRSIPLVERISRRGASVMTGWTGESAKINSREHLPARFEKLIRARASKDVDLVWFNYARVCPSNFRTSGKVVIDMHDIQTRRIENDVLPNMSKWRRGRFLRAFRRSEIEVLENASLCVAISQVESDLLRDKFTARARIATINATLDRRELRRMTSASFDLLFVGSNSTPNVAGLSWFLEEVWPRLDEVRPSTLRIIGRVGKNSAIVELLNHVPHSELIECVDFVEDLAELYSNARVVICPVLHGTGMKIKVVEAMAWGAALVATGLALEGIPLDFGLNEHNSEEEFVGRILELLSDERLRRESQRRSLETHRQYHSRAYLNDRLRDVLRELEIDLDG